jgi:hypothetical protein
MKLALLVIAASCLPVSLNAQGQTHIKIQSAASERPALCMDIRGDHKADATQIQIWTCHGRENQRWNIKPLQGGASAIEGEGFCVDVRGAKTANGTPVQIWKCHFKENQRFIIASDGEIKEEGTGKCLELTGTKPGDPVVISPCNHSPAQIWKFEP